MAALGPGERWYVAQTLANREAYAQRQLENQAFRVFLPRMMRNLRHARRIRQVLRAVFPGYVFVALDLNRDRWRSINGTIGVSRLIMAHDAPIPTPNGVVEALAACVDPFGVCRFERKLGVGQSIRVTAGPFADLMGRIASLDDKGRARVLLEIMGGAVVASLDAGTLEPA